MIQYLTGRRIEEVMAVTATLDKQDASGKKIGVDDNSVCIYKMDNGIVGTMTASWTNYGAEENWTVLYGTEGVMHIYEDPKYSIIIEKKDGSRVYYQADQIQTNTSQTKSGIIDAWISCLTEGREPEISGEEALDGSHVVIGGQGGAVFTYRVNEAAHKDHRHQN